MDALTVKKIAQLDGHSIQAVHKRATKEDWIYYPGANNTKKFILSSLPRDIRLLYNKVNIESAPPLPIPADRAISPAIPRQTQRLAGPITVSRQSQQKALAKADLLRLYMQALKKAAWGKKNPARETFVLAYNSGMAWPRLYEVLGPVSWKTIEGWKRQVKRSADPMRLADRRGTHRAGESLISDVQEKILLRCLLHPNRPLIAEAIRMAKAVMDQKGIENGYSESTYRRWVHDWKTHNIHIWTFSRKGAKAWNDECAYYIERDYNLINVGDILVADGHVLNFEIINPWTGKPKRMMMILWYDMKSNFPLGWEILPTENTQGIASALRRAILRLGKIPKVAYLDNGKAFSSKFFNGANLEEAGFAGLFERLGMKTIFAWPYHGQSKTIERFFGTFAELERWCPTYTGTSIEKKPPRMMRGERIHRKVYEKMTGGGCLTLEQAHMAVAAWFDQYVARTQKGHLAGAAPAELFLEGRGPGVDPATLQYLMMSAEIKQISRQGIHFPGRNYYNPLLHGRRHGAIVRYDLQDDSEILVFEKSGEYICSAQKVEKVHPAARVLGTDADVEKLKSHVELKKRLEKAASVSARQFMLDEVLPEHQANLARAGVTQLGPQTPMIEKQAVEKTDDAILLELAERETWQEDETALFFKALADLPEMERYEKLIEAEIRGWLVPQQWQTFMSYYEQTTEFEKYVDYFDDARTRATILYQVEAKKSE